MAEFRHALHAAACVVGIVGPAAATPVIPPGTPVAGISQATLANDFYRWLLEAPGTTNPLFDPTGASAHIDNNGPVFLLAGSGGGGFLTRHIGVPLGRPLFVPVVTTADIELPLSMDPASCLGAADPTACALAFLDKDTLTGGLEAKLDGIDLVADFSAFFQQSTTLQSFCPASSDNLFGVTPPECGGFVQKGFYIALDPLTPGTHVLEIGSVEGGFGVIDHLTVPEPPAIVLFGFALTALGLTARRRRQG